MYDADTLCLTVCVRSGVIWQVERKKGHWKTLNTSVIALLEEAYLANSHDLKLKDLVVGRHIVCCCVL